MVMLFGLFWETPFKALKNGFLNLKFASASLVINFLWTPGLAIALGAIFLSGDISLRLGFLLLLVTPCTDWYLIFTGLAKGNVPLSASILPMNLAAQIALLPVYVLLFFGLRGRGDTSRLTLFGSTMLILIVPLVAAKLICWALSSKKKVHRIVEKITAKNQFLYLAAAVAFMFASESKSITQNPDTLLRLLWPLMVFYIVNFLLAAIVSKTLKFTREDGVSLSLTTLARNSPLSLALCVHAFPDRPLAALALVIGALIELPVLALITQLHLFLGKKS
jgi:ACR3 family arsenite efflux pump ArsB